MWWSRHDLSNECERVGCRQGAVSSDTWTYTAVWTRVSRAAAFSCMRCLAVVFFLIHVLICCFFLLLVFILGKGGGVIVVFSLVTDFFRFSHLTEWVVWGLGMGAGTQGTIQRRSFSSLFCRRPSRAVLAWIGMSTLSSLNKRNFGQLGAMAKTR